MTELTKDETVKKALELLHPDIWFKECGDLVGLHKRATEAHKIICKALEENKGG